MPIRVLVVDDVRNAVETLRRQLLSIGYEAEACTDATECLGHVKRFHPDVVLLDLSIPALDGFEIARQLLSDSDVAPCRLIALTGLGGEEIRQRCADAGFDCFLLKPASRIQITDVIGPPN